MNRLYKTLKSKASKAKFALGQSPFIEKKTDGNRFVPFSYKAVLSLVADFELAWAWRYGKSADSCIKYALACAQQERTNISEILHLCEQFNLPITWATVGHLFLDSCGPIDGRRHPEIPSIDRYRGLQWDFNGTDWFEHDPCSTVAEAPEWYAPDLIQQILCSPVRHEIGCHTFSHIDCREKVCPSNVFLGEIRKCKDLASQAGINITSFVHPGHTIGNLDILRNEGFTSYQTDPGNVLGYPRKHDNGLWEIKRTQEFVLREGWSIDYHIQRYMTIIDRAIKTHTLCCLWFHPSFSSLMVQRILPAIFDHIDKNRDQIYVTAIGDYVDWLQRQ